MRCCDHRLTQGESPIVGGNLTVGEGGNAHQPRLRHREKRNVLIASTRESDCLDITLFKQVAGDIGKGMSEAAVEVGGDLRERNAST